MPKNSPIAPGLQIGASVREHAKPLLKALSTQIMPDFTELALTHKQQMLDPTAERLTVTEQQHFASGLLRAIDDLAVRRRVAEVPKYMHAYTEVALTISRLASQRETVTSVGAALMRIYRLIDEIIAVDARMNSLTSKQMAQALVSVYAPAKSDPILAESYAKLAAQLEVTTPLSVSAYQKSVHEFTSQLAEFRRTTRLYLTGMVKRLRETMTHYRLQPIPDVTIFLQEADMLLNTAVRPVEFQLFIERLGQANNQVTDAIVNTVALDQAKAYLKVVFDNLTVTTVNGALLSSDRRAHLEEAAKLLKRTKVTRSSLQIAARQIRLVEFPA